MTYQLRYLGEGGPDPETVPADSLEAAVRTAQNRLQQAGVTGVALMADGFVVCTFSRSDGLLGLLDDQILASAGIYRFGSTRMPADDPVEGMSGIGVGRPVRS